MLGWQRTYASMPAMRVEPNSPGKAPDIGCEETLCLADLIPMDLIRTHTKTDDVPSNTDEQLNLYRQAAIESAEMYTGLVLGKVKPITEEISVSFTQRAYIRGYVNHRLSHPTSDGIIYLYGYGDTRLLKVAPRSRKIKIPIMGAAIDLSSACCRGDNSDKVLSSDLYVLYKTGFANCNDIPAGIILGCLKFIAWCVTHPGDEILAVRNRTITRSSLVDGTNNIAWASGAIELWRQYDPEAI